MGGDRRLAWTVLVLLAAPIAAADGDLDDDDFYPPNGFVLGPLRSGGGGEVAGPVLAPDGAAVLFFGESWSPFAGEGLAEWIAVTATAVSPPCALEFGDRLLAADALFDEAGRLVVAGAVRYEGVGYRPFVARFLYPDCTLDASFDGDGFFTIGAFTGLARRLARVRVQVFPGIFVERVVLGGDAMVGSDPTVFLVRLRGDGSLDSSFGGGDGLITLSGGGEFLTLEDLEVDASGGLLLLSTLDQNGGSDTDLLLVRRQPDGEPDSSFGFLGVVLFFQGATDHRETSGRLVVAPDGDLYVGGSSSIDGGSRLAINRFSTDGGRLDEWTWDTAAADSVEGLEIQGGGRLILTGRTDAYDGDIDLYALARTLPGLAPDPWWGDGTSPRTYVSLDLFFAGGGDDHCSPGLALLDGLPAIGGQSEDTNSGLWVPWLVRLESALVFTGDFEAGSSAAWSSTVP